MIRFLFLLFFIPTSSSAEPASVRSGEHSTFSRLVVTMPAGSEWTVRTEGNRTVLKIEGLEDGFRTESVFDRIPRDRVSELEQVAVDELAMEVLCDCHVDAFLWRPGQLVLDIVDGPMPGDSLLNGETEAAEFDSLDTGTQTPAEVTPSNSSQTVDFANLLVPEPSSPGPLPFIQPPFLPEKQDNLIPDLVETEAALLEGLARAAAQGLLETPSAVPLESTEIEPEPQSTNEVPTAPETALKPGVGVSTAMDRDLALIGDILSRTPHQNCLPADYFEIDSWAGGMEFSEQLPILIEALAGEFGQPSLMSQDRLAQFYLFFGFGAEARLILSEDSALSISREVMLELSNIVDDRPGPYPTIESQLHCDTQGAIWAFIVSPGSANDTQKNAIVRRFFLMPQPLKGQIAPMLSRSFMQIGDPYLAEYVLAATSHQDVEGSHIVQAAHATAAAEMNDTDFALDVLSREAEDTARITPDSAIKLVELTLEQGEIPTETDLLLLATLRQEHKHDEGVVLALEITEASGWAAIGQYDSALSILEDREDQNALAVRDDIFQDLTISLGAADFLGYAYAELPNGLSAATENAMSRRLIDLGFPDRTGVVFRQTPEGEDAAERRYLRAEAALSMGEFDSVFIELEGMSGDRALDLVKRAHAGLGDHEAALRYAPPSTDSDAAVLGFRAEAWDRLALDSDPVLSNFASSILPDDQSSIPTTLSDREAMLRQSQESRQAIEDLLTRFDRSFED